MTAFKDNSGREWRPVVTVRALGRVREATGGFELGKLLDENMRRLQELAADPELLCKVLFALCPADADRLKIDLDTFMESVAGDALADAFDAFLAAYADFCPSQRRALLLTLAEKSKELETEATAAALDRLRGGTASGSPTSSPASSESTPPT